MKIFLVGFMGAGKTTIGRKLARALDFEFYDSDLYFEEKFHFSIYKFFEVFGEQKFREFERDILMELFENNQDMIISTGGGTACFYENMKLMNGEGITVYVKMHLKSLKHRLLNAKRPRPAIHGLNENEMELFIKRLLTEREKFYEQAKIVVKGEDCDISDLVGKIRAYPDKSGLKIED